MSARLSDALWCLETWTTKSYFYCYSNLRYYIRYRRTSDKVDIQEQRAQDMCTISRLWQTQARASSRNEATAAVTSAAETPPHRKRQQTPAPRSKPLNKQRQHQEQQQDTQPLQQQRDHEVDARAATRATSASKRCRAKSKSHSPVFAKNEVGCVQVDAPTTTTLKRVFL